MDTTNKHIGNVLSNMKDSDVKEVLQQYMKKCQFDNEELLIDYFQRILKCDSFSYEGNMIEDNDL